MTRTDALTLTAMLASIAHDTTPPTFTDADRAVAVSLLRQIQESGPVTDLVVLVLADSDARSLRADAEADALTHHRRADSHIRIRSRRVAKQVTRALGGTS